MELLVKMASLISDACRDAERLPVALISCGVVQAAAALCLLISRPPGGIFLHHGKAPFYLYYAVLIAVFVFGLFEASAGFWVSSNVNGRRAAGKTILSSPLGCFPFHTLNSHFSVDSSSRPAPAGSDGGGGRRFPGTRDCMAGADHPRDPPGRQRVGMVVSAVKGRAIGNEPLAQFLAILKELLYDADDVVDELDYYRLQQQVQGVTRDESEGMHGVERVDEISRDADTPNSSVGKLRSVVWQHFKITEKDNGKPVKSVCRYCAKEFACEMKNGTSSMSKHINKICKKKPRVLPPNLSSTDDAITNAVPVVIGDSCSRKRRRVAEDSTQIIASNTQSPWDKDILSSRIQKITSQLQDIRGDLGEFLKLHGSDLASSSNHHPSTDLYQNLRTSSLVPRKVYGRVAEKDSIIKMITEERSDGVAVLPIVGIAGVGKTTLAQLIYNDPNVESQFDQRIWVWVSHNFDEVRLTSEMLDFVSPERHEGFPNKNETYKGINSFAKLQEVLKGHMQFQSKRFLLILDDVSDNMDGYRWNKVLPPLRSSHVRGSVILVTTRNLSVAERVGSLEPIKLGSLADNDLRLLFKLHAFGDENYEVPRNLSSIWRQIAENLKGNPLAAESTGILLRKKLSIDHWNDILKNEGWKSMQLGTCIMPALKLSYDRLPYYLQQCFSYCSIFPDSYQFRAKDLVHIWISQGFVKCNHSSKRLEEIGQFYLTDLVNLGFFQKVGEEEDESSLGSQSSYSICGLMHDFARMISRNYCATIDSLLCTKMLPTIQHISVVTDSAYNKDRLGHICRNNKFEEKLRNAVMSPRKLRTLVLIGKYDSHFFQVFQDKFRTAHNLRLLQVSATSADFNSLVCSSVDPTHLRYFSSGGGAGCAAANPAILKAPVCAGVPSTVGYLFKICAFFCGRNTIPGYQPDKPSIQLKYN
ncbi:hypothetical protein ACQ4PT_011395 [Festuca glaucescens]